MNSFTKTFIEKLSVPTAMAWMLGEIAEAKGRQETSARQSPHALDALRDMALIQSVESSNRIEGVTVAQERLRPLVLGDAKPRDRSEMEIHGYRQVLNEIHTRAGKMIVNPELILRFHKTIQAGSGDAGQWKKIDNEIVQLQPQGPPIVRFKPTGAEQTPETVEALCRGYRYALDQTKAPPLLLDALMVLDFLCIHPFRDGNGRVSRLLTLLALYQHGYQVGRFISIERLVEESKEDYYDTLHRSSQAWHEARHDWKPFASYYLGIIHRAYRLLEESARQHAINKSSKSP